MKKEKKHSLLWELTSKASNNKSYLLGTMHVKDYRAFIYQDVFTEYIDRCKIFATEFDLRERAGLSNPEVSAIPNNKSLLEIIGERKYNRLKKIIKKSFSINLDLLNRTLPLFAINMLTEKILTSTRSIPLDTFLWQYAENTHRELRGVETFAEQLETLANIPLDYQIKSLLEIGKNPKKFRKQINSLITQYVNGDIQGLYKKSKKSLGKQRKILLYNRNEVMCQRIIEMTHENSSFIAIGAAHLSGKKGVLRLLKQAEISVKPVNVVLD